MDTARTRGATALLLVIFALVPASDAHVRARLYTSDVGASGRRLRGDWERPDALVLVFAAQWSQTLAELLEVAIGQTDVYLLADPRHTSMAQLDAWLARFSFNPDDLHVVWTRLDSAWVRDYGPLQVMTRGDAPIWLDADYVPERGADDEVPETLSAEFGARREPLPFRLDGGALASNGRGLCVATNEYFAENALDLDDPALREALLRPLGCRALVLVPALHADPNHHADMLAQFLAADVVAIARVDARESTDDAARMDEAARGVLEAARALGEPMRVIRVPTPYLGKRGYRTYLNALRLPHDLVVPSYDDVPDAIEAEAHELLASALPDTDIVPVPADALIPLYGSLHCISLGLSGP